MTIKKYSVISIKIVLFFILLTGIIYPLTVTGIAQILFKEKANGSIVIIDGKAKGSILIGQQSDSLRYFSPRPSYISYNPMPSGGSNIGLTNNKLRTQIIDRKKRLIGYYGLNPNTVVPSEMLFSSASGLDPHIPPEAALLQTDRISENRKFSEEQRKELAELISKLTEEPEFHLFGQRRINVFLLNLGIDTIR